MCSLQGKYLATILYGISASQAIDLLPVRASTCACSAFGEQGTLITQNNDNKHFPSKYLCLDRWCFCLDTEWKLTYGMVLGSGKGREDSYCCCH
mmetsp:Transcript_4873/g.31186  ORF Transcript_4873/g.31186 Transcript_4873/m.31186 type:complete len:94 (+) Transcript_4873:1730-2011(+)